MPNPTCVELFTQLDLEAIPHAGTVFMRYLEDARPPRSAVSACRAVVPQTRDKGGISYSSFRNAESELRRRSSSVVVKRWTDPLIILGRAGMPAKEGIV